jgi:hypothetical protein
MTRARTLYGERAGVLRPAPVEVNTPDLGVGGSFRLVRVLKKGLAKDWANRFADLRKAG